VHAAASSHAAAFEEKTVKMVGGKLASGAADLGRPTVASTPIERGGYETPSTRDPLHGLPGACPVPSLGPQSNYTGTATAAGRDDKGPYH